MPTDPSLPDRMADVAAEFLAALDGRGRAYRPAALHRRGRAHALVLHPRPARRAAAARHGPRPAAPRPSAAGAGAVGAGLRHRLDDHGAREHPRRRGGLHPRLVSRPRPRPADVLPERLRRARRGRLGLALRGSPRQRPLHDRRRRHRDADAAVLRRRPGRVGAARRRQRCAHSPARPTSPARSCTPSTRSSAPPPRSPPSPRTTSCSPTTRALRRGCCPGRLSP